MKSLFIFIFTLIFYSLVNSQTVIDNQKTEQHISIKETKIFLIPPPSFTQAKAFKGLQLLKDSLGITVLEIPNGYSEISKNFTKEKLAERKMDLVSIEDYVINGLNSKLMTCSQKDENDVLYKKYILCFGNDEETVMLNSAFPLRHEKMGEEMKKSMLTVVYNSAKIINPEEEIGFKLDLTNSKFKFVENMFGNMFYNLDGKTPTLDKNLTVLIISKASAIDFTDDKKEFTLKKLNRMSKSEIAIDEIKEITINGLSGYEVSACYLDKSKKKTNIYYVSLFGSEMYYLIQGETLDTSGEIIKEIKKLASSFKED